jgi:catechol 2,3-dioxygenase-like lactoylglutathione lyase family enzyme
MEPCVHVITLAVDDLQRALTFYRDGLGLPTNWVVADEYEGSDTEAAGAIVIFKLAGGLILSLYPRTELAKDARIPRRGSCRRTVETRRLSFDPDAVGVPLSTSSRVEARQGSSSATLTERLERPL